MYTIIGIQRRTGKFEGNDYDNVNFFCLCNDSYSGMICGTPVQILKVKTSVVFRVTGLDSVDELELLMNARFTPFYDQYKHVVDFRYTLFDGEAAAQ